MSDRLQAPSVARGSVILKIVATTDSERSGEEVAVSTALTIGRGADCDVVLSDASASRRHARVELAPHGTLKLIDLGSANGVWVGSERITEATLRVGDRFRIGSTVFECRTPAVVSEPAAPGATVFMPVPEPDTAPVPKAATTIPFVIRVVEPGAYLTAGREIVVQDGRATIGRAVGSTLQISDGDVSRNHAVIEVAESGFRITDLRSTCGVWIGDRQIQSELVAPGQRFRIGGHVVLECLLLTPAGEATPPLPVTIPEPIRDDGTAYMAVPLAPPAPSDVPDDGTRIFSPADAGIDFSGTIVMPASAAMLAQTRGIQDEGEAMEAFAHKPFLLNDPDVVYYVVNGGVLIFTVTLEKGVPAGPRAHFLGVVAGQCFMGFAPEASGSAFLVVAKPGTQLRKIARRRFEEIGATAAQGPAIATLVDTWVKGLAKSLAAGLTVSRAADKRLTAGQSVELTPKDKASATDEVLWIDIWSGAVLFDDLATPVFKRKRTLFPLTPDSWVQPIGDEFGALLIRPMTTVEALRTGMLWHGLTVFHEVLCECEFVAKKLATADEYVRLQQKAKQTKDAEAAAYADIGSVMTTEGETPREFLQVTGKEPVLQACALVGHALGIQVRAHPAVEEGLTYEELVAATASASGFRTRVVALREGWWEHDHGPLLAQRADSKGPVALLPTSPRSYECIDPKDGTRQKVNAEVAATLTGFGFAIYRPFPEQMTGVKDLLRFAARGLASDLRWVLAMAVIVGVFGMVTPYLTGRLFDEAIPQADRTMLWTFGLALVASAIAAALFKFTQGVATVRVQARMESSVQAAVWDRLLNLPVNFFRKYSAGDLADRAAGVDQIQQLISGAGVAAILGSISGLFYVVQMFSFDTALAMLAIGLTALFVGTNTLANYLQLRHQRVEMQMKGRITGLVLNLISGVSKLRICGAEPHAFRVWAQHFADQRRVAFKVGTIQNGAATFGASFPVLSSIAIFMVMVSQQEAAAETGVPAMTTGDFIAFTTAYGLFMAAMQSLGDASLNLLRIVPIYERLRPILETKPEVDSAKAFPGKLTGAIELSHVNFRYGPDGPWIVKDLSLSIKAGEFVAFVGSSGCGKSTLMRLMLGFEQPTSGSIAYDGQDLSSVDLRLVRQQMGVVLQVSRVMPTEIYRNIIGATSRTIQEAWEAAEKAGLAEDIKAMPMGMHTYVSEGGGTLSGGQRQRLMIARAIVNKPKILFLDEATSALDNRAQAIVTESMDRMDATRIVIAHRLSTIINAHKICYLEGGQIIEMGTYQELMDKNGKFAELARRQMV